MARTITPSTNPNNNNNKTTATRPVANPSFAMRVDAWTDLATIEDASEIVVRGTRLDTGEDVVVGLSAQEENAPSMRAFHPDSAVAFAQEQMLAHSENPDSAASVSTEADVGAILYIESPITMEGGIQAAKWITRMAPAPVPATIVEGDPSLIETAALPVLAHVGNVRETNGRKWALSQFILDDTNPVKQALVQNLTGKNRDAFTLDGVVGTLHNPDQDKLESFVRAALVAGKGVIIRSTYADALNDNDINDPANHLGIIDIPALSYRDYKTEADRKQGAEDILQSLDAAALFASEATNIADNKVHFEVIPVHVAFAGAASIKTLVKAPFNTVLRNFNPYLPDDSLPEVNGHPQLRISPRFVPSVLAVRPYAKLSKTGSVAAEIQDVYFTAVQMTANPAADTIRNNLADACVFSLPVTHDALHLVTPERDKGHEDDWDHAIEDPAVIVDAALEADVVCTTNGETANVIGVVPQGDKTIAAPEEFDLLGSPARDLAGDYIFPESEPPPMTDSDDNDDFIEDTATIDMFNPSPVTADMLEGEVVTTATHLFDIDAKDIVDSAIAVIAAIQETVQETVQEATPQVEVVQAAAQSVDAYDDLGIIVLQDTDLVILGDEPTVIETENKVQQVDQVLDLSAEFGSMEDTGIVIKDDAQVGIAPVVSTDTPDTLDTLDTPDTPLFQRAKKLSRPSPF